MFFHEEYYLSWCYRQNDKKINGREDPIAEIFGIRAHGWWLRSCANVPYDDSCGGSTNGLAVRFLTNATSTKEYSTHTNSTIQRKPTALKDWRTCHDKHSELILNRDLTHGLKWKASMDARYQGTLRNSGYSGNQSNRNERDPIAISLVVIRNVGPPHPCPLARRALQVGESSAYSICYECSIYAEVPASGLMFLSSRVGSVAHSREGHQIGLQSR